MTEEEIRALLLELNLSPQVLTGLPVVTDKESFIARALLESAGLFTETYTVFNGLVTTVESSLPVFSLVPPTAWYAIRRGLSLRLSFNSLLGEDLEADLLEVYRVRIREIRGYKFSQAEGFLLLKEDLQLFFAERGYVFGT